MKNKLLKAVMLLGISTIGINAMEDSDQTKAFKALGIEQAVTEKGKKEIGAILGDKDGFKPGDEASAARKLYDALRLQDVSKWTNEEKKQYLNYLKHKETTGALSTKEKANLVKLSPKNDLLEKKPEFATKTLKKTEIEKTNPVNKKILDNTTFDEKRNVFAKGDNAYLDWKKPLSKEKITNENVVVQLQEIENAKQATQEQVRLLDAKKNLNEEQSKILVLAKEEFKEAGQLLDHANFLVTAATEEIEDAKKRNIYSGETKELGDKQMEEAVKISQEAKAALEKAIAVLESIK